MMRTVPILAACLLLPLSAGCCKRQACGGPAAVTAAGLAADPGRYAGREVTVAGTLDNAGTNYFTDLRLELRDGGSAVAVRPWLPLEVPPPRPGATARRPAVLSDYLGQRVRISGTVRREGETYQLEVRQAEIITEEGK